MKNDNTKEFYMQEAVSYNRVPDCLKGRLILSFTKDYYLVKQRTSCGRNSNISACLYYGVI